MKTVLLPFLKERTLLFVVLVLFITAKVFLIDCPFYWDESWSYEPGIRLMYEHGPSLMPNAIDLFYSRGHPLLFYASAATWMHLFGPGQIAQHAFSLFISAILIVSTFEISLRLFNKRVANFATLLLCLQVMFFVQSSMLLPEVMVALFALLTLWFYSAEKYLYTFLACTALMFTKESGMVMGLVLGIHASLSLLNTKELLANRLKNFLSVLCSGFAIGLFFVVQKKLNGWYLFPEHVGYIKWNWQEIWDKFRFSLEAMFCMQNRYILFRLVMLLSAAVVVKTRNWRFLLPAIQGLLIYEAIEIKFGFFPRKVLFLLLLSCFAYNIYLLAKAIPATTTLKKRFLYVGWAFFTGYLLFSCINFLTVRYLLGIFVLLIILTAVYLDIFITQLNEYTYYALIAGIILIGYLSFRNNKGIGDVELGSYAAMKVQNDLVHFLESSQYFNKSISASSFQEREHLQKPLTGFLHTSQKFETVTYDVLPTTDYILFDNIEPDVNYDKIKKDTTNFRLVFRAAKGPAWGEIYGRKTTDTTAKP